MTIIIDDLQTNTVLDSNKMAGVRGGMGAPQQFLPYHPKKPGYGLGYPTHLVRKDLTNISEQLNIAVGSANVIQANSNSVSQY